MGLLSTRSFRGALGRLSNVSTGAGDGYRGRPFRVVLGLPAAGS